jgi:hypothetical protein
MSLSPSNDGFYSFITAQVFGEKVACIIRRWFIKLFRDGKKLGTSGQHWLADSRYLVLVIFKDLFLCHGDTATAMEIPQCLFVYTRHFVIVFGFYSVPLLPDG